jgi:hypothetical protein
MRIQHVIFNPDNGLLWNGKTKEFVREMSGRYSRYISQARAEYVIRRTVELRHRGLITVPEPAHERALQIAKVGNK